MSFVKLSEDHNAASSEIFLDTSIHCSKLKGSLFKSRIAEVLSKFKWKSTSTYTKVEFGNVVLCQAEYYLRKLMELKSLEKVRDFIGNVLPHGLHKGKVTWAFNLLDAYGENDADRTERATYALRRLMKFGMAMVDEISDRPLANGTDCYWAKNGIMKKPDGTLEWKSPVCKQSKKWCRVDEFFIEKQDIFLKFKQAIDALPEDDLTQQLKDFSDVIDRALRDPKILLDYKTGCKKLADAIIAADSVGYASVFSQNIKESDVLTQVLGQNFYYLPPNPERGVLVRLVVVDAEAIPLEPADTPQ